MTGQVNIIDLLTLIEEAAKTARVHSANAAILSASMDLRAAGAKEAADGAMKSLLQLTGVLQSGIQPAPKVQIAG